MIDGRQRLSTFFFRQGDLVLLPAGYSAPWVLDDCFALLWQSGHVDVGRQLLAASRARRVLPPVSEADDADGLGGADLSVMPDPRPVQIATESLGSSSMPGPPDPDAAPLPLDSASVPRGLPGMTKACAMFGLLRSAMVKSSRQTWTWWLMIPWGVAVADPCLDGPPDCSPPPGYAVDATIAAMPCTAGGSSAAPYDPWVAGTLPPPVALTFKAAPMVPPATLRIKAAPSATPRVMRQRGGMSSRVVHLEPDVVVCWAPSGWSVSFFFTGLVVSPG